MADRRLTEDQMNQVLDELFAEGHEVVITARKAAARSNALKERVTKAARDHTEGCTCTSGRDIFRLPSWMKLIHVLSPSGFTVPRGTRSFDTRYFCKCQVILRGTSNGSVTRSRSPQSATKNTDTVAIDTETLNILLNQANELLSNTHYEQAIPIYQIVIAIDRNNVTTLKNIAQCFYEIEALEDCISSLTRLLNIDPSDAEAYLSRARCYDFINKPNDCLKDVSSSLKINASEQAYELRADVEYKLKKYDLALNDYAKAFELAPDKIDLLLYMAMTAKTMGKPKESEDYEKRYRELRDNS